MEGMSEFGNATSKYYWSILLMPTPTCHSGRKGSEREVDEVSGNCHKHFKTQEHAEVFIEDWKQTVIDL